MTIIFRAFEKINKKRALVVFLVLLGLVLRAYHLEKLAGFDFDGETAARWVKAFLIDRKMSLVGQETSIGGVYTGPGYFYLLSLFYDLLKFDPISGNVLQLFFATGSMVLIYLCGGFLPLFVYVFSARMVTLDQGATPSNPLIFLALLVLYSQEISVSGLVAGLSWHFHPTGVLFLPIVVSQKILAKSRVSIRQLMIGLAGFFLFLSPLVIFEIRHSFLETKRFWIYYTAGNNFNAFSYPAPFKFLIITRIFGENVLALLGLPISWPLLIVLVGVGSWKRKIFRKYFVWFFGPVLFFSFYPGPIPEYYLLITFPAIVLVWSKVLLSFWWSGFWGRAGMIILLLAFVVRNLGIIAQLTNPFGLYFKKQAVEYAIRNSTGYPTAELVAGLGQGNGFSYLFWWRGFPEALKRRPAEFQIAVPSRLLIKQGAIFGDIKVVSSSDRIRM